MLDQKTRDAFATLMEHPDFKKANDERLTFKSFTSKGDLL